jgi:uncharacterized membrane protein
VTRVAAPAAAGVHAHRVIFIDLARALAVVLMIAGHSSSALLGAAYRTGPWVDVWVFQRGLTAGLFLLLSGFAFSVATTRHWTSHLRPSMAVARRIRRFGLFVLLGYALHFPVPHIPELAGASDGEWRGFLAVDVLQLIGVTFIAVQLLVMLVRSRRAFMAVAFALAGIIFFVTPAIWRVDWTARLPLSVAAYLSQATDSQFPLFPWAGFVLLGAAAGQLYARWGAAHLTTYANWGMLVPGAALIAVGMAGEDVIIKLLGGDPVSALPAQVFVRAGICFVILGVVAHASRSIRQLPHVFGAVAQESLIVYFVHLCLVYGSPWAPGLYQFYAAALTPALTILTVLAVLAAMIALAWQWNRLKHVRPRTARWASAAAGALLVARLI